MTEGNSSNRRSPLALWVLLLQVCLFAGVVKCQMIHHLVARGDLEAVRELIESRPSELEKRYREPLPHGFYRSTPLMIAAKYGHDDIVRLLLEAGADLNAEGVMNTIVLNIAVEGDHTDIVRQLLEGNANVYASGRDGNLPLHLANSVEMCKLLLGHKAPLDRVNSMGATPLLSSLLRRRKDVAYYLIEQGSGQDIFTYVASGDADGIRAAIDKDEKVIKKQLRDKKTLLHVSSMAGQRETIEFLLEKGFDVNASDKRGATALHFAPDEQTADTLIANGADVEARIEKYYPQWRPIHLAANEGRADVVEVLLEHGADVHAKTYYGHAPLHIAANPYIADLLRESGADIEEASDKWQQNTPLYQAAKRGRTDVVRYLLEKGAVPRAKTKWKEDPLHVADNADIVQLLLDAGGNVNVRHYQFGTPLTEAVFGNRFDVVSSLLANGADIHAQDMNLSPAIFRAGNQKMAELCIQHGGRIDERNSDGQCPLHRAVLRGSIELIRFYMEQGADVYAKDKEGRTAYDIAVRTKEPYFINAFLYSSESYQEGKRLVELAYGSNRSEREKLLLEACDYFEKACSEFPGHYRALCRMSMALASVAKLSQDGRADEYFKRAHRRLDEADETVCSDYYQHFCRGYVYLKQARNHELKEADEFFRKACVAYEKAVESEPKLKNDLFICYKNWGRSLLERYKFSDNMEHRFLEQALDVLTNAEHVSPGKGLYDLACAYALKGNMKTCQLLLEKCKGLGHLPDPKSMAEDGFLAGCEEQAWFKALHAK